MHAHFFRALLTLSFVFAVGGQSANSQLATPSGLAPSIQPRRSPRVETIQFHSALVGKTLPYNVILPTDYRVSTATRYPVIYLLHGWAGHYSDWVTRTNIADYAAPYRFIVVMPEGNDGWYTDSATVASDKYESYILQELIPDVQRRYRTIESRYGRAIAGLSMGGYGALKFGLKSPGTFAFAGSLSGALAATTWTEEDLKAFKGINDSLIAAFGARDSPQRKLNDIFEIARGLSASRAAALPYFYLDCGTEDFFLAVNEQFAALLSEKKIAHEFRELPGNHGWQYWDQQVKELLRIAAEKLQARRIGGSHVDRSSTDDQGSKTLGCDDPKGYSVEEGTVPGTNSVNVVRDGRVLHTIKLLTGMERNGFGFNGAKKTKDGFEISIEYGSVIYYNKTFIFTCRQHKFYLSKIGVDSFNKHNPEKWSKKVIRVRPYVPIEKFSITDFMLEGVAQH